MGICWLHSRRGTTCTPSCCRAAGWHHLQQGMADSGKGLSLLQTEDNAAQLLLHRCQAELGSVCDTAPLLSKIQEAVQATGMALSCVKPSLMGASVEQLSMRHHVQSQVWPAPMLHVFAMSCKLSTRCAVARQTPVQHLSAHHGGQPRTVQQLCTPGFKPISNTAP